MSENEIKRTLEMPGPMVFRADADLEAEFDASVTGCVEALAKACHAAGMPLVCGVQVGPDKVVRVLLLPDGVCQALMGAAASLAPEDFDLVDIPAPSGPAS